MDDYSDLSKPKEDYSDLSQPKQAQLKEALMDRILGQAKAGVQTAVNFGQGAVDTIDNLFINTANVPLGALGIKQIPTFHNASGNAYEAGKFLGDIAGFAGGGEALEAGRVAGEALPYIGKLAEALGKNGYGLIKRAIGSGTYGAIENPENRLKGGAEGILLSAGLEGMPAAGKAIYGKISPKKYSRELFGEIGNSLENAEKESTIRYGKVLNRAGHEKTTLGDIDEELINKYPDLKQLKKSFEKDPTIDNAHKIQSQLGTEIRTNLAEDQAAIDRKSALSQMRETVQDNIEKSLAEIDPELVEQYRDAAIHHRNEVVPRRMTHEALQNMTYPTPRQIDRKLESVKKNILYPKEKLGVYKIPEVPEDINALHEGLGKVIRNKNIAELLGGATLGGVLGHKLGPAVDLGLFTAGAFAPKIIPRQGIKSLEKKSAPNTEILSQLFKKGLSSYLLQNKKPMELELTKGRMAPGTTYKDYE